MSEQEIINSGRLPPEVQNIPPDFTFAEFAVQPEYVEVNRGLIKRLLDRIPKNFFHIDVATGTGLIPKIIIQESKERGFSGTIIGIDPDLSSLNHAKATTPQTNSISVEYIAGRGEDLIRLLPVEIPPERFDSESIHDALHEIEGPEEKMSVLVAMKKALKPGGLLSFNSAFTTFGIQPDPISWGRWKLNAFKHFEGKRNRQAQPITIYKPEEYKQMIEDIGLTIIHEAKVVVNLSNSALEGISRYPKFIEGVFGDMIDKEKFTLQEKSSALINALQNVQFIPRGWYEIIAQKPLT